MTKQQYQETKIYKTNNLPSLEYVLSKCQYLLFQKKKNANLAKYTFLHTFILISLESKTPVETKETVFSTFSFCT